MKADLNYSPSDVYETLPRPANSTGMAKVGQALNDARSAIMKDRQIGLTKIYNLLHDPTMRDAEIQHLRLLHSNVDQEVLAAYDWPDINMEPGFHQMRQGLRYGLSVSTQTEILDRLLELNYSRHDLEQVGEGERRLLDSGMKSKSTRLSNLDGQAGASSEDVLF